MADARRLAQEHRIQVTCTLEHFFALTVESDAAGTQTWTTADGYALLWWRSAYSGDRPGLDHLTVRKGGQDLDEFSLYHDTESDAVETILKLIAPEKQAAEVTGHLS